MTATLRLGVLVSGRGSNMQAIHNVLKKENINAEIALIVSNRPSAAALKFAEENGLSNVIVDHKNYGPNRQEFEQVIDSALNEYDVDVVVLAGFMRILSEWFIQRWNHKIINIHPSLLPAFPGLNAQEQALNAGVKLTGCTVHFVDEGTDTGPIIAQRAVPVLENDTNETLSARVLREEHQLLPEVIKLLANDLITVTDNKVKVKGQVQHD